MINMALLNTVLLKSKRNDWSSFRFKSFKDIILKQTYYACLHVFIIGWTYVKWTDSKWDYCNVC